MSDECEVTVTAPKFVIHFSWNCPHCNFYNHTVAVSSMGRGYYVCSECESDVFINLRIANE